MAPTQRMGRNDSTRAIGFVDGAAVWLNATIAPHASTANMKNPPLYIQES